VKNCATAIKDFWILKKKMLLNPNLAWNSFFTGNENYAIILIANLE
jgi:hypothetical protein